MAKNVTQNKTSESQEVSTFPTDDHEAILNSKSQQKHCCGIVSINLLRGLNQFYRHVTLMLDFVVVHKCTR